MSVQQFSRLKGQRFRTTSKKERARLSSLENPLLYANLKNKLEKLNPGEDIESLIDRSLEPEEALFDIKKHHPEINIGLNEHEGVPFRDMLDDLGIEDHKVQNLVAKEDIPLTTDEINTLAYVLQMRSEHAKAVDKGLKAPLGNLHAWIKAPNRTDIVGIDR